jgi:hypothetical protein
LIPSPPGAAVTAVLAMPAFGILRARPAIVTVAIICVVAISEFAADIAANVLIACRGSALRRVRIVVVAPIGIYVGGAAVRRRARRRRWARSATTSAAHVVCDERRLIVRTADGIVVLVRRRRRCICIKSALIVAVHLAVPRAEDAARVRPPLVLSSCTYALCEVVVIVLTLGHRVRSIVPRV